MQGAWQLGRTASVSRGLPSALRNMSHLNNLAQFRTPQFGSRIFFLLRSRRWLAEVVVDAEGGLFAVAHGKDDGGATAHDVAAGEHTG
jgi:hypothetical protein